jgi:transcriptional regulator with XRE-family HTH domain
MARNLKDLRRAAGFRSGREFAEAMGINQTTYRRYEQQPDGIPLKQAWAIADRLGCSIDMVVGREPVSVEDMRGDVQKLYDGLDQVARRQFDDYVEFTRFKASKARRQRELERRRKAESYLRYYERLFYLECERDPRTADLVVFGSPDEVRAAFEGFLRTRERGVLTAAAGMRDESEGSPVEEAARVAMGEALGAVPLTSPDGAPGRESTGEEAILSQIMAAYDEEHGLGA